jgi:hypothetical protein
MRFTQSISFVLTQNWAGKADMTYGDVAHDEIPQVDQIGLEY